MTREGSRPSYICTLYCSEFLNITIENLDHYLAQCHSKNKWYTAAGTVLAVRRRIPSIRINNAKCPPMSNTQT